VPEKESFRTGYADPAEDRFVVGSPEDCLAALPPWRGLGVDHVVLRTDWAGTPVGSARAPVALLAPRGGPRSSPAGPRPDQKESSWTSASSSPSPTTAG